MGEGGREGEGREGEGREGEDREGKDREGEGREGGKNEVANIIYSKHVPGPLGVCDKVNCDGSPGCAGTRPSTVLVEPPSPQA